MKKLRLIFIVFVMSGLIGVLAGCLPPTPAGPCEFTANMALTAYRLPADTSQIFGTISIGDTYQVLARTADGWVGFDPGIAQAGNIGLAHHRWVQLNASLLSSCLSGVDLVTISEVEADIAASGS